MPQPAGSLVAPGADSVATGSAAADEASAAVSSAPDDAAPARFTYAVMSLPAGTMATTSHPSADFSESFAASEAAS